jgi:eukaryotic-like serine/threonine-protein kinase
MHEDSLEAQCRARVGQLLSGKWRLDALIGVGGMAAVYMATHRNGSIAAIKLLHDEVAGHGEVRERFLREAYIANKVGHPGTVKVLDDDEDESGRPYLVMELLQGESVEGAATKVGGRLSIDKTLEIVDQTLAVLEAAHAQTIVHRDLKPENLFLTTSGQVKVLDFGIARLREENTRKTQTGMVMGTPTFMAPEQAMGRWGDVDGRTDIYALGATAFTLLSGLPVHEAETVGEMLVAAATRPARSLARVLNNAPFPLVALVDRALAYERSQRFPDAATFRAELAKVRSALAGSAADESDSMPARPILPGTVHGEDAPDGEGRGGRAERLETFDVSSIGPEQIEQIRTIFTLLERSLVARKQYGAKHPETARRTSECFKQLVAALMRCEVCLAWTFTPYALVAGEREEVVWEPEAPWNRVPYQLFADGVRTMGFTPGIEEPEFLAWLELITLDPTVDLAPEDDLVTRLWDANFDCVFHKAIDSFAEGTQEQRARFELDRKDIIEHAHVAQGVDLEEAWQKAHAGDQRPRAVPGGPAKQIFDIVGKNLPIDAEAAARAANLNVQSDNLHEARAVNSLAIDEATRALLAARLDTDVRAASERFVIAAAEAFVASARMGRSQAVSAPLRRAVDGLGGGDPGKAMDMIIELRESLKIEGKELETDSLRNLMTAEVLSPRTLQLMLQSGSVLPEDTSQVYLAGLGRVLGALQAQHFESAIAFLPATRPGRLRQLLFDILLKSGAGLEAMIGALFKDADMELGLELVRLLMGMESDAARDAITLAANSPHPLVRIEALGHLEGVSGGRVREEMRKLLGDPQNSVRMAALQAMEQHRIAAAGAFLVLRIQDPAFLQLPAEERRQSLQTLATLRPKRCEEVCIELLKQSKLLRPDALESTREFAARHLGELARTDAAYHLLESLARSRPWNTSQRVRKAAANALDRLNARAKQRIEGRKSVAGTLPGAKPAKAGATRAAAPAKGAAATPVGATRPDSTAETPPGGATGARRATAGEEA